MTKTYLTLEDTDRRYDSLQARYACCNPASRTWAKYRQLCRVPSHARLLTEREICSLLACTKLHRLDRQRGVTLLAIAQEVNRLLVNPIIFPSLKAFAGDQPIPGHQVPQVMAQMGYKRSRRTWERYGWSARGHYTPEQLRRFVRRIEIRSPKAACG